MSQHPDWIQCGPQDAPAPSNIMGSATHGGNIHGCYGSPFKGYHRVTQGYILYPKIFNFFVNSAIRQWVMVVATAETGEEGSGETAQEMVT